MTTNNTGVTVTTLTAKQIHDAVEAARAPQITRAPQIAASVELGAKMPAPPPKKVEAVTVERHEGKIMIPTGMTLDEAASQILKLKEHLNQEMMIVRDFATFPWDGAAALQRALKSTYGWVPGLTIPGSFFKPAQPPATISIEVGYGRTEQVPWGRFAIPGVEGYIETGYTRKDGLIVFQLQAKVLRKYEGDVEALFRAVMNEVAAHSIYQGQAVRMRFKDEDGERMMLPEIKFLAPGAQREQLIFSRDLEAAMDTNLFAPIERARDCIANDISVRRGVLLGGKFGTGKTLAASVAATLAVKHGITYLYVPRADELVDAVHFARQYSDPACVIFCEDIDRVVAGERSVSMDDILNVIDGVDSKGHNLIHVLTTNELEDINPAMLRPGRLDAVIDVTPPDAEAVERLLRVYGGAAIAPEENLKAASLELAGRIPAVLTEVVKRAKLAQLRRLPEGSKLKYISAEALLEAARTMTAQLKLMEPRKPKQAPGIDRAFADLWDRIKTGDESLYVHD
jgi:transitional endoplasmic reticulum ATPase